MDPVLDAVMARATADPNVLGVVLTGSRARGLATTNSDYDLTVVVAEQAEPWRHDTRTAELDEVTCTPEDLADTSVHWRRYGFRGARVLLDRGGVADLVKKQATFTDQEAVNHARASLDAYINQLYRSVKSYRDGFPDAARMDEAESVPWLLETVFALHGRLRPYNKYLAWELETYPLDGDWNAKLRPGHIPPIELFGAVESLAGDHADVFESWGDDIALIRAAGGFADQVRP